MKKILCILLSVIMVALLAGCGSNPAPTEPEKPKNDLVSIDALNGDPNSELIAFDSNEKYLTYIYDAFTFTEADPENAQGEGEGESEGEGEGEGNRVLQDCKTYLVLYDIEQEEKLKTIQIDEFAYTLETHDDNIQVWVNNEGNLSSTLYDFELNEISAGKGKPYDANKVAHKLDAVDNSFDCKESVAINTNWIKYQIMIFYDDCENYYFREYDKSLNALSSYKKLVLDSYIED